MTVERENGVLDARVFDHEKRLASLEAWRDNKEAQVTRAPAWTLGLISAAIALASVLLQLYLSGIR